MSIGILIWLMSLVLGASIDGGRGIALSFLLGPLGVGIACYLHRNDEFKGKVK